MRVQGKGREQTRAGTRQLDFYDVRVQGQGHRSSIFTVWKRHSRAPWIFSECTMNATREGALDSAPGPLSVPLTGSRRLLYGIFKGLGFRVSRDSNTPELRNVPQNV